MQHKIDGALSLSEFCSEYKVGLTFAYQEINSGRLPAVKLGRHTRIPRQGARDWFQALPAFLEEKQSA
jgi:excisionase family DNA binding protein